MTFLPVVQRELRIAAVRKSTFRIRSWSVLIAFGMGFLGMFFVWISRRSAVGPPIFSLLTAYTFGLCLLAGPLLTADCLSQEKREGTLGLLFLTDLKGYDVVLGKFIGASLNAFYALIALLPIVAVPVLAGGITGAEFWRSSIALLNALFFSLAAGVFVSTFGRDSPAVLGVTLALVLAIVTGLPYLSSIVGQATGVAGLSVAEFFGPVLQGVAWLSPFCAFSYAREGLYLGAPGTFWGAFAASNLLAWSFLAIASGLLPRIWQQRAVGVRRNFLPWRAAMRGNSVMRGTTRAKLLSSNPVLWLMGNEPLFQALIWILIIAWGVAAVITWRPLGGAPGAGGFSISVAKGFGFALKMLIAVQACRFFSDSRRDGTLELLLNTPLRNGEIIRGQWLAMKRLFFWPLLALVFLYMVVLGMHFSEAIAASDFSQVLKSGLGMGGLLYFTLNMAADFFAIGWFGMWLALTTRRPNLAAPLTILIVLIVPSIALCGLDLLVDVLFIAWGASKLQTDFRWILSEQYTRRIRQARLMVSPAIAAPPVIAQ